MMVFPVSVMHEHVHKWARRQEQPRQVRDEMGAMFSNDEEAADDGEQHEDLLHSSSDDVSLRLVLFAHGRLLSSMNFASTCPLCSRPCASISGHEVSGPKSGGKGRSRMVRMHGPLLGDLLPDGVVLHHVP